MYHIIMISLAVVYLGDMIKSALIMTDSRTRMINGVCTVAWAFNKITATTYERPISIKYCILIEINKRFDNFHRKL